MSRVRLDAATIADLRRRTGAAEVEAFVKQGRSRRLVSRLGGETQTEAHERGWAVRATTERASFFACGTGELDTGIEWPAPEGRPLRLPDPTTQDKWTAGPRSEAPLAAESELRVLARDVQAALEEAIPGARLELLELEDGHSESRIGSSRGVMSGWRTRIATVVLEASSGREARTTVRAEWLLSELRQASAGRLAGRVANLMAAELEGRAVSASSCDIVASPEVATVLIAGLMPLFDHVTSESAVEALGGPVGLGSSKLTLVDDGRLAGGALASAVDGEGAATSEVVLIERGTFEQPLLPWWQHRSGCHSGGCSRRDSWRDLPTVGPSHLYLRPAPEVGVAELIDSLSTGYYLLDACGPPRFDFASDRFELPTRGFELRAGRARTPVARVRLAGGIGELLRGLRAVARDLTFVRQPCGLLGSPTVLLSGLEMRE